MYRVVTGVTSDFGVPSTYLVNNMFADFFATPETGVAVAIVLT